jgi:ElaB/YqjD/DUF883 family membrane-anchored ribosome-binding protein
MASKTKGHKTIKHNGHALKTSLKAKMRDMYRYDKKKINAATKAITKAAKDAKDKFVDVEETVEDYAKTNPWKTIGMSLLAGVLVGKIMHK